MRVVGVGVTMHHVVMVANAPKCMFDVIVVVVVNMMHAIVVGHRKRHQIASCTEFTQKIHHADDDDDARHQAAQHHHHRPIGPRAATTVFRPFGMLRPHGEQQMPTTTASVPASTAVFFGCRRYRDASVDTEFFAR